MERTYKALIEASHSQAVKSGWWEGGIEARSLDDQFNNFHAEVSESWEEYRAGRMATWYSKNGVAVKEHDLAEVDGMMQCNIAALHKTEPEWAPAKPEGFWVEIADLLIRLADTCGAYEVDVDDFDATTWIKDVAAIPAFVASLHRHIESLREDWDQGDKHDLYAGTILDCSFAAANHAGVDLWAVIEEKMAYNATRSFRHGGKKA